MQRIFDTTPMSPGLWDTARELLSRRQLVSDLFDPAIPIGNRLNRLRRVLGREAMRPDAEFGFPSVEAELDFVTRYYQENDDVGLSELIDRLTQLIDHSYPNRKTDQ